MTGNGWIVFGLGADLLGAVLLLVGFATTTDRAIWQSSASAFGANPATFASQIIERHDRRYGFGALAIGLAAQFVGALGYTMSMEWWLQAYTFGVWYLSAYLVHRLLLMFTVRDKFDRAKAVRHAEAEAARQLETEGEN
jgi:hypothetical protein